MVLILLAALAVVAIAPTAGASGAPSAATIHVPHDYSTIQAAINAALPGSTIRVGPGTFVEQLSINKSLRILGAGADLTKIVEPTTVARDVFGNYWAIEILDGARVALSGFTLTVSLQCINLPGPSYAPLDFGHAGGGIGVGGSSNLTLTSADISAGTATEGANCTGAPNATGGFMSYGTGVAFGLDYVGGAPAPSQLVGSGTVTRSTISGFGVGGPGVSVGGGSNSPAGSYALISHDSVTSSSNLSSLGPAVAVGWGGNASRATIEYDSLTGVRGSTNNLVEVFSQGSSAVVDHSLLAAHGDGIGAVVAYGATLSFSYNTVRSSIGVYDVFSAATISHNLLLSDGDPFGSGIVVVAGSASIAFNTIRGFQCGKSSTAVALGLCGPSYATQLQDSAVAVLYGSGVTVDHNWLYNNDVGVLLGEGCSPCAVAYNSISNSIDYGLAGADGNYTFVHNSVSGGSYAIAAIAATANCSVKFAFDTFTHPTLALAYYEIDLPGGTATIVIHR